jgi:hypothetical protein
MFFCVFAAKSVDVVTAFMLVLQAAVGFLAQQDCCFQRLEQNATNETAAQAEWQNQSML